MLVTIKFIGQGITVILKMTQHENATEILSGTDVDAVFYGAGQHLQGLAGVDGVIVHSSVAGLGNKISIVKATH